MKYSAPVLLSIFLLACGTEEQGQSQDSVLDGGFVITTGDSLVEKRITVYGVTELRNISPDRIQTPWEGEMYEAAYWKDLRGENEIIISGNPQFNWPKKKPDMSEYNSSSHDPQVYCNATDVYARHYVRKNGETDWTLCYEYYDYMIDSCNVYIQFQPSTLCVMDADSNGTGEVIFMCEKTYGESKKEKRWWGSMPLLIDSTEYVRTGLTATPDMCISDLFSFGAPEGSPYQKVTEDKWALNCAQWKEILDPTPSAQGIDK